MTVSDNQKRKIFYGSLITKFKNGIIFSIGSFNFSSAQTDLKIKKHDWNPKEKNEKSK